MEVNEIAPPTLAVTQFHKPHERPCYGVGLLVLDHGLLQYIWWAAIQSASLAAIPGRYAKAK